jgi:hypothetical protein
MPIYDPETHVNLPISVKKVHQRAALRYCFPKKRDNRKHHVSSRFTNIRQRTINLLSTSNAFIRRMWRRLRPRRIVLLLLILSCLAITAILVQPTTPESIQRVTPSNRPPQSHHEPPSYPATSHPMWGLITHSQKEFEDLKARQSTTLQEAVAEYRSRYGIPPPPNFDKWYNFAKENNIQLIDEFDTIHQLLTPFWGLKPATIRARAREALGYDNNLLGVLIRHGNITKIDAGREWMQDALKGMTEKFVSHLPDMDLCFNIHDEPRVMLQHDDLARLVAKALNIAMPAANAVLKPRNQWSWHPTDMVCGLKKLRGQGSIE